MFIFKFKKTNSFILKRVNLGHLTSDVFIRADVRIVAVMRGLKPAALIGHLVVDFLEHHSLHKDLNYVGSNEHLSVACFKLPMPTLV